MKKSITIMTICFLSFLCLTNTNAQNNTWPWPLTGSIGIGKLNPTYKLNVEQHISIDTLIIYPNSGNGYIGCYMIGDTTILHDIGLSNTFCGKLTGVAINGGYSNS